MISWLPVSLQKDLDCLLKEIRLPDYSEIEENDHSRRINTIEISATLPGLRMCEQRRIFLLTQSAPPIELAVLSERLNQLNNSFEELWPKIEKSHEKIIINTRSKLIQLNTFVKELNNVYQQREMANQILENLDDYELDLIMKRADSFAAVFPFLGYEVDIMIQSLQKLNFPDSLIEEKKKGSPLIPF